MAERQWENGKGVFEGLGEVRNAYPGMPSGLRKDAPNESRLRLSRKKYDALPSEAGHGFTESPE